MDPEVAKVVALYPRANRGLVDVSLVKRSRIAAFGEQASLDFRFEAFNLFNRANFALPDPP